MLELFLIRHGLTAGNKEKRYIGRTDEPLCQEGMDQLKQLSSPPAEMIFVSPMKRCVQTARILYPDGRYHIIDEFRECDFGEFENKNYLELTGNENIRDGWTARGRFLFREEKVRRNSKGGLFWDFKERLPDACEVPAKRRLWWFTEEPS